MYVRASVQEKNLRKQHSEKRGSKSTTPPNNPNSEAKRHDMTRPEVTHRSLIGTKEMPIRRGFLGAKFRGSVLTKASRITVLVGFGVAAIAVVYRLSVDLILFARATVKAIVIFTTPDARYITVGTIPVVRTLAVFRGAGIGPKTEFRSLVLWTSDTSAVVLALEGTSGCGATTSVALHGFLHHSMIVSFGVLAARSRVSVGAKARSVSKGSANFNKSSMDGEIEIDIEK